MTKKRDVDSLFDTPPDLEKRLVKPGELDDIALLPKRFDMFAAEVRQSFELLGNKLLPAITRIDEALRDLAVRVTRIERDALTADRRLAAIEQELGLARRKQAKKRK